MTDKHVEQGNVVWLGKPYIIPALIIRTITVIVLAVLFLWLEVYFGDASAAFWVLKFSHGHCSYLD